MIVMGTTILPQFTDSKIITFTQDYDLHAFAVDEILKRMGAESILFSTSSFLIDEKASVWYDNGDSYLSLKELSICTKDITSVWYRRVSPRLSLPENVNPSDVQHIRSNARSALIGIASLFDDAFIVNSPSAKVLSTKLNQLKFAERSGLRVPKTIITNNYVHVLDFINKLDHVCLKSLTPYSWQTNDGFKVAMAHRLTRNAAKEIITEDCCKICPMIYQEYIEKRCEYRVTIFGNFYAAVRINSQELDSDGAMDWRADQNYLNNLEKSLLPDDIISACKRLLKALGLRFGTFDLAETPDGEFVFFEVNQAGQWLWQELFSSECIILQPFCEYLCEADDNFVWDGKRRSSELSADNIVSYLKNTGSIKDPPNLGGNDPSDILYFSDEREVIRRSGD